MRTRLVRTWRGVRHLAPTAATGFASLLLLPVLLLTVAVALVAPGRRLAVAPALRAFADRERVRIDVPVPVADDTSLRDPVLRRDLRWYAVHAVLGTFAGLVGFILPAAALNALLVPAYWWLVPADDPVTSPYPVTSWALAATMPLVAVGYTALAMLVVPPLARWYRSLTGRLLAVPADVRLAERVAELTASRAAALEAHGAELRRIERDLHDGTQNKLVAVAMHLGIVERALRRDPAGALPMVLRAQDATSDALAGLRDVVRSIYPPVLAERGLDGAVAGLIARCPVPCALTTIGPRRAPAAVESAAYFVVAEALTNIAKHSGATQASVVLTRADTLTIEVHDNGHGGADENLGTGLSGIARRVAAFDGSTTVTSPPGGPTLLRVELPCGT
ncbi:sensor histidine kinase [Actinophytocola gossypii]|uniref:histidine kinase n=1 Tax=Actinophytocola gossypii TaxID=2812003 RepID=A0ABT2JIL7_9PSEU|nr:histidine kinase [Actinophytocola gossypii]MCT2587722.1 sensor domain-containing protein [Actinophytocola gossypii]